MAKDALLTLGFLLHYCCFDCFDFLFICLHLCLYALYFLWMDFHPCFYIYKVLLNFKQASSNILVKYFAYCFSPSPHCQLAKLTSICKLCKCPLNYTKPNIFKDYPLPKIHSLLSEHFFFFKGLGTSISQLCTYIVYVHRLPSHIQSPSMSS